MNHTYRISSNKRHYFEALRRAVYSREALNKVSCLFQTKENYIYEITKRCDCLFPNNSK